ncbi:MAG TPA: four-carbon acid sugar kinase family protein, partial [Saprospiraceae bacterium]|nr:four-carbon acid sugar kinase family protein [Saprospiraceae bacterium]
IFFIITNSRALTKDEAEQLNEDIGKTISSLIDNFYIISRGDSTLRGHFFYEVDSLAKGLNWDKEHYLTVFLPAFIEGNRLTKDNTHYLVDQESWIPVHHTPYAQDKTFGYQHSNLVEFIIEKTNKLINDNEIQSLSIANLEKSDTLFILEKIKAATKYLIVNALTYEHIDRFASIVKYSERKIIFRTSASFAASFGGVKSTKLLSKEEIYCFSPSESGGLIVVGSHVPNTSVQFDQLMQSGIKAIELEVEMLLDKQTAIEDYLKNLSLQIDYFLGIKEDVVLYTSRKLITAQDETASLKLSQKTSNSLVSVVKSINVKPKFIISKGGITSSDIATYGLSIKRAIVLGQVEKGISVWQTDESSKFPLMPFIVFPGNVGSKDTLKNVYDKVR